MRNPSPVVTVLNLRVVFIGDAKDTAPVAETDQHAMSRVLLHRLIVLVVAMQRIAQIQCAAAQARNV